ncbi:luciferase family oxidoreductase, group 1 [Jatrophihabitans endophyticus]|uniref:Luciferase family oxidoreductase, group 1 n=1 Tax=Jatrophihabitans endophyticus TaxID=1206085 RepID=A0A1M5G9U7_9ACTN|nr:LLM class flavin-dependent oxidoreductase [Jatrophihabitans endophyticus]SHG00241.1 luciferase family oxidoreductase, group 1 [Jatrophihabitans endophyticus]
MKPGTAEPLPPTPLSVLDLAPVAEGTGPTEALQATIAHARRADELGLSRFWVAEHHSMPGIASSAPAVLIGAIAAATERIRVGSGGVMLPNHAPLAIAEQFGTLAALHPGRIDLGLGRAPGSDQLTAHALRRGQDLAADNFPEELGELACFLADDFPADHPYRDRVVSVPAPEQQPPLWLLGSSLFSAELAGMLGLPFAFAHHFAGTHTLPALERYRSAFREGGLLTKPYAMVTVQAVCAPTDEEADRLALPSALSFLRLRQGNPGKLPTAEQAAAYPWSPAEQHFVLQRRDGQAIGSPQTVAASLRRLLADTEADELMITTQVYDLADRIRSLELVRGLFDDAPLGLQQG